MIPVEPTSRSPPMGFLIIFSRLPLSPSNYTCSLYVSRIKRAIQISLRTMSLPSSKVTGKSDPKHTEVSIPVHRIPTGIISQMLERKTFEHNQLRRELLERHKQFAFLYSQLKTVVDSIHQILAVFDDLSAECKKDGMI